MKWLTHAAAIVVGLADGSILRNRPSNMLRISPDVDRVSPSPPATRENTPKRGTGVGVQELYSVRRGGRDGLYPFRSRCRYVFLLTALKKRLELNEGVCAVELLHEVVSQVAGYSGDKLYTREGNQC
ncbi:MAG: hypothetical protein NZ954_05620 [Thermofilaceae archaeon]|nr:hypothetical protein [Thermofilaceae archaeon]MCX8180953.1 hypothetical protein [Thermofilaceae archaeon]MDW8004058.1 hypothetical protein [Thermofilaceae archaeon]